MPLGECEVEIPEEMLEGLDKDKRYLMRHPTRIAQRKKEFHEANRDETLRKRRERYHSHKGEILQRKKEDRVECPICHFSYGGSYIKKHMQTRHKHELCKTTDPQEALRAQVMAHIKQLTELISNR